ncbi:hypothetical protein, partial [Blautia hydrogenotrophica]|uniref:hypothetical protein n=1 Tax=Blautia hydrogenotrophica TaxID=53443 RepID=UPI003A8B4DAE
IVLTYKIARKRVQDGLLNGSLTVLCKPNGAGGVFSVAFCKGSCSAFAKSIIWILEKERIPVVK